MIKANTAREITNNSYIQILNELEHNIKEVAQCGQYSYRWEFNDPLNINIIKLVVKQLEGGGFTVNEDAKNKIEKRFSYNYCYTISWEIVE